MSATDKKSNRHASVDGLEKQLFFIRWEITELFFLSATDKKSNRHASVDGSEKQLFFTRWEITQLFTGYKSCFVKNRSFTGYTGCKRKSR